MDQKRIKKSRELPEKASYTTTDIKAHFQVEASSTTVTSGPVKVIDSVKDDIGMTNQPAVAQLPQSKPVIHEEDVIKEM